MFTQSGKPTVLVYFSTQHHAVSIMQHWLEGDCMAKLDRKKLSDSNTYFQGKSYKFCGNLASINLFV